MTRGGASRDYTEGPEMTINEAINALEVLRGKHGADVQVYFDCPHCTQSFTPDVAAAKRENRVTIPGKREPR